MSPGRSHSDDDGDSDARRRSEEREEQEASIRRNLLAKRKRSSDRSVRDVAVDEESNELFAVQPAKRTHRSRSRSSSVMSSRPDEGLSTTPDSFEGAGTFATSASPDRKPMAANEQNSDNDEPMNAVRTESTDSGGSPKPIQRHIDDDDIRELLLDDLTDEQKAILSPEQLQRLKERTQAYYVSKLPIYYPGLRGCRAVSEYECLNKIDEGTFGVVYRAKENRTGEICALKRLKLDRERDGFPVTSLREVNLLLLCREHPNVVNVKEIVVGNHMDKVYLVMEYVEHDLKALIEQLRHRGKKFSTGQVKTLTYQLLSGIAYMHDNWMIHRDLKTSNLLLSHKGILKIGDFGLARTYGHPIKPYTPIVVTLWYRSPELLLGAKEYSTAVDMWSVGCIMAEFILLKALFPGQSEIDQVDKIFHQLGTPSSNTWPGYDKLPGVKHIPFKSYPYNQLRKQFHLDVISERGLELLNKFFIYNTERRVSASEALQSPWFTEAPLPTPPDQFPTWPARSEKGKIPPPSRAPPPEPVEPVIQLDDETRKLYEQFGIDAKKASKAKGPLTLKL